MEDNLHYYFNNKVINEQETAETLRSRLNKDVIYMRNILEPYMIILNFINLLVLFIPDSTCDEYDF